MYVQAYMYVQIQSYMYICIHMCGLVYVYYSSTKLHVRKYVYIMWYVRTYVRMYVCMYVACISMYLRQ